VKKYCCQTNMFGFRKKCIKEKCVKWITMYGPNEKGERVKKENCADAWKVILVTELTANVINLKRSIDNLNNIVAGFIRK